MEATRFAVFKRELEEIVAEKYALRSRLEELLGRYEIPELTSGRRIRARKCKLPLVYLHEVSSENHAWIENIAGRSVGQWGGSYSTIYMCLEMDTFQLKRVTYQNGNSRWGIPETSRTYCKLISPAEVVDLLAGPSQSEKNVDE